jgi:hypothetical protein
MLRERLTGAFFDYLARNRADFGERGRDCYEVSLENVAPDGSELDLVVTLQAGATYCCSEPGCHFDFRSEMAWAELRSDMDAHGLRKLPLPVIRTLRVVVEAGALFDPGGLRSPPLVSKGYAYEEGPFVPAGEPGQT